MTYVLQGDYFIIGTAQTMNGAMILAKFRFEKFCRAQVIYGVNFPDIREGEMRRMHPHWEFKPSFDERPMYWRLEMGSYGGEFRNLRMVLSKFVDTDDALQLISFQRASDHFFECPVCSGNEFLNLENWPDEGSKAETLYWRMYHSCDDFRMISQKKSGFTF